MSKGEQTDSYRSIFKATSLFGGVQVFTIIVTIARAKIVAVLLGSEGMGLNGLFLRTIELIKNATDFGIPQSAVKDIAQHNSSQDKAQVYRTIAVFRRLVWISAFLALAVSVVLSLQLSKWVFGSGEYRISFMLLGITFIFGAVSTATFTVLRGLGKLRFLATSSVLGSVFGLLASIPLYYYIGIEGVVPALIASSIIAFLIARYYEKKIAVPKLSMRFKEALHQGRDMIKLGFVLSLTMLITSAVTFAISAFITRTGSLEDLGFYNAGYSITAGYTGMIFTAMLTDYFPRLSAAVTRSDELWRRLINEQTHLLTIILTPILLLLITTLPWVIRILLTDEFLVLNSFVSFIALGIFVQGPTWAMGVIIIAMGDLKMKLYTDISGSILFLVMCLAGYYYWGLWGIGLGYFSGKMAGLIITYGVARIKYKFSYDPMQSFMISLSFMVVATLAIIQLYYGYPFTYYIGLPLFVISAIFSLYQLNQKVGIVTLYQRIVRRNNNGKKE